MGKLLIIKGADFSRVAVENIGGYEIIGVNATLLVRNAYPMYAASEQGSEEDTGVITTAVTLMTWGFEVEAGDIIQVMNNTSSSRYGYVKDAILSDVKLGSIASNGGYTSSLARTFTAPFKGVMVLSNKETIGFNIQIKRAIIS